MGASSYGPPRHSSRVGPRVARIRVPGDQLAATAAPERTTATALSGSLDRGAHRTTATAHGSPHCRGRQGDRRRPVGDNGGPPEGRKPVTEDRSVPNRTPESRPGRGQELEQQVISLASKNDRLAEALTSARQRIVDLQGQLDQVMRAPGTYGTFLSAYLEDREADVMLAGRKMRLAVAATLPLGAVRPGQEVRLNEQLAVVAAAGYEAVGDVAVVREILDGDRVLAAIRADDERVLRLAGPLLGTHLRLGDAVVADLRTGFATDLVQRSEIEDLILEEQPDTQYADIGGLDLQIEQIRDAIELPFTHPELYREHGLRPPKGVLLYGPPGTGKTLIARAVAHSLAQLAGGENGTSYFLNIKGPKLLNKFVGETERQIRVIFARARERASSGVPVIVFFDEMESLFRIRGAGVSSDVETTIVPQLLAEIDGVETLDNVVVIGASNREDMIDPAILRPGRLDLKIRIDRPDARGAVEIFSKYLTEDLPLHPAEVGAHGGDRAAAVRSMIEAAVERLYSTGDANRYLELTYADGTREVLFVKDFVSGALIANVVDRAKKSAIKDLLATGERGISRRHVLGALEQELRESEDLRSSTDPDQWSRITGRRGGRITHLRVLRSDDDAHASVVDSPSPRVGGSESAARAAQGIVDVELPEGVL
nr:proteasome ATPase [Actinomycetales bacterium]